MNPSPENLGANPQLAPMPSVGNLESPPENALPLGEFETGPIAALDPQGDADPFVNLSDTPEPPINMPNVSSKTRQRPFKSMSAMSTKTVDGIPDSLNHDCKPTDEIQDLGQSEISTAPDGGSLSPNSVTLPPAPVFSPLQSVGEIYETLDGFRDILDSLDKGSVSEHSPGISTEITDEAVSEFPLAPVFSPLQNTEEIYETLDGFRDILDSLEAQSTPRPPSDAPTSLSGEASIEVIETSVIPPSVEIIEAQSDAPIDAIEPHSRSAGHRLEYATEHYAYVPYDLELDPAAGNLMDKASYTSVSYPLRASNNLKNSELATESKFNVREFSDSADGVIEPIHGSYELDPDTYDHKTAEQLNAEHQPTIDDSMAGERKPATSANEVFLAKSGDIIKIDGDEGFDHIDLTCFDVEHAVFRDQVIVIDDHENSAFEIHHQNIEFALFANEVEVDLT